MWDALSFINLLACGIVQGTYTFEMVVVVPALNAARADDSAMIHASLFSHLPNRFMPICGIAGAVTAAALALLSGDQITTTARAFYGIGLAFWTVTFVILVGYSRPLDKRITGWVQTAGVPVDEYPVARRAWDRLMYIRGPAGLVGLSCFIVAALS